MPTASFNPKTFLSGLGESTPPPRSAEGLASPPNAGQKHGPHLNNCSQPSGRFFNETCMVRSFDPSAYFLIDAIARSFISVPSRRGMAWLARHYFQTSALSLPLEKFVPIADFSERVRMCNGVRQRPLNRHSICRPHQFAQEGRD
jgi:hypothetical protein